MKKIYYLSVFMLLFMLPWAFAQAQGIITTIDAHALKLMMKMDPNLVIIDVRSPDEYAAASDHVTRSLNIPLEKLQKNASMLKEYKNMTLVFVGKTELQSKIAAMIAAQKIMHVYLLKGGVKTLGNILKLKTPKEKSTKKVVIPTPPKEPLPLEPIVPEKGTNGEEEDFGC